MRRRALVTTLLGFAPSGCLGPETVECPGGGVCPSGLVCRLDRDAQVCVLASCGNGVVEAGEGCDDGNNDSGDACAGDCITPPTCGNGFVDFGEDCDDGNRVSGDGCQATCRFPIRPAARWGCGMAYDSSRNVLVMFGGYGEGIFNDTWEWNGTEWIERDPPFRPRARGAPAMTFDSVRNRVLMFGGYDVMGAGMNDLWEWDGQMWRNSFMPTTAPSGRGNASLAFDTGRGVAVLFGGEVVGVGPSDDTWEWNGSSWTLASPARSPEPRAAAAMTFDESQGRTILVGGPTEESTWMWNGTTWSEIPIASPNEFGGARLAYDRARGRTVFFGGFTAWPPIISGGTWELVGAAWVDRSTFPRPEPREGHGMAYVDVLEAVVVFGGIGRSTDGEQPTFDDLWSWDGTVWRQRL